MMAKIGSRTLRSIICPLPLLWSRSYKANMTAQVPNCPATASARPVAGSVGGPAGWPVTWAKPLIASARVPKPGLFLYGPVWPNPDTRTMTRRGLSACSTSHPSPQRSRVPGRKFSVRTSASATSCLRISCPSGVFRSRVTHFLLRLVIFHHKGTSFLAAPSARRLSPRRGCSTLITSAPKSPIFCEIVGAAKSTAMSTILSPSNGRVPMNECPSSVTFLSPRLYLFSAGRAKRKTLLLHFSEFWRIRGTQKGPAEPRGTERGVSCSPRLYRDRAALNHHRGGDRGNALPELWV